MNRRFIILSIVIILYSHTLCSQTITRVGRIPIYHGAKQLKNPFTGGMNASIISQMDLNRDGKKDLVIVQYRSFKISTYLNEGNGEFQYAPRYEAYFPQAQGYFLAKDMNEDGMEDLLYMGNPYILIYKGFRSNDSTFSYSIMDTFKTNSYDTLIPPDYLTTIAYYIPILEDIDRDGDVDIVSVNRSRQLVFHKNLKKEKAYTNADKNEFWNYNMNWGQHSYALSPLAFKSNAYSNIIRGIAAPKDAHTALIPRHDEFQMVWHLDVNNDGLYDVVAYSENQKNGPLGVNTGTKDSAFIVQRDTFFPSYSQPITKLMPNGFWLDVDNDGKRDILSSFMIERDPDPNLPLSFKAYNDDVNTIEFYKNYGTKQSLGGYDSFAIEKSNFLTSENIDVGTRSAPIFYDFNGDSLEDILVPNSFKRDSWDIANITYYKNIGTKLLPKYELSDVDLFNYKSKNRVDIRLVAGDLNNDGYKDLLISSFERSKFSSDPTMSIQILYDIYFQKFNPITQKTLYLYDTLNIEYDSKYGQSNMCLYDLNKDGKLDLFSGDLFNLRYYENKGNNTKPNFSTLTHGNLIHYDSLSNRNEEFNFYPAIRKDPSDNRTYLYFAYFLDYGRIGRTLLDSAAIYSGKHLAISNKNVFSSFKLSLNRYPTISFGDINADNADEMLVGNYAGGAQLFSFSAFGDIIDTIKNDIADTRIKWNEIHIYPNPFAESISINSQKPEAQWDACIYTVEGKMVFKEEKLKNNSKLNLAHLEDGFYFICIFEKGIQSKTFKLQKSSTY